MLTAHATNPHTKLVVRATKRPSTFVLIDNQVLLWQLNEIQKLPDTTTSSGWRTITRMHGVFVITARSPENPVLKNFADVFDEMEDAERMPNGRLFEDSDLLENI